MRISSLRVRPTMRWAMPLRRGSSFCSPAKRRRLRVLAQRWLAAHDEHAPDVRFDVVGVLVRPTGPAVLTHLRGAFQ